MFYVHNTDTDTVNRSASSEDQISLEANEEIFTEEEFVAWNV